MTIRDIAALAGVSITTVSMILNNKDKDTSFSEETREKVLRIAKEYNFGPYAKTARESSARSGLVGLLIPGTTSEFSELISGAQEVASAEGYSLVLCSAPNERELKKQVNNLLSRDVDGVAVFLSRERDLGALFAKAPEKVVYTAVSSCQAALSQCTAYCSFSNATKMAGEHLLDMGHRNITLIGWKGHFLEEDLVAGYTEALRDHDIAVRSDMIHLCDSQDDASESAWQMTYGQTTAFLCQDTKAAACVYRSLSRHGLHIPQDYSVVSVSDDFTPADVFDPELTMVDLQGKALGEAVMVNLIDKIEGKANTAEGPRHIEPKLRDGASAIPPKALRKRIVVVGSINMDVIINMPHIPTSGESLLSQRILNLPGGKGANQAVGAAKLGGDVSMIGCLGEDQEGRLLYKSMADSGVNTAGVQIVPNLPTGKAYILVAENGDSTIVRAKGANEAMTPDVVEKNASLFENAELCLLSTEIPWETVLYTVELCTKYGVKIIMKPTIQYPIPDDVLKKVAYLIPNQAELRTIVKGDAEPWDKAICLVDSGVENVIVTLGDDGCYLHTAKDRLHFPAANFTAVDTTGAGDAFISAFAVYLSEGHTVEEAIRFATYAAGISVTRDGVQPALADRMAVEIYSDQYSLG